MITGPSDGSIGGQTAIDLAVAKPALILLAGRSLAKIQPVIDQIAENAPEVVVKYINLDLTDNSSVRQAAADVKAVTNKINVLINNAGGTASLNHCVIV